VRRAIEKGRAEALIRFPQVGALVTGLGRWGIRLAAVILVVSVARAGDEPVHWNEAFREAVAPADRLVLEGVDFEPGGFGTWHELSAVRERRALEEITSRIHVAEDDPLNGKSCCCDGTVRLVFLRGEQRLAVFSVHHGRALRWRAPVGPWTGDGRLTRESAVWVSEWIAAHGDPDPLAELRADLARDDSSEARWKRYAELLPASAWAALRSDTSREPASRILLDLDAEPAARLARWLRLFGCHEDDWALDLGIDQALELLLIETPDSSWSALLLALPEDADLRRGVARALFAVSQVREGLTAAHHEAVMGVLPVLAPIGLTQPRIENRRLTMAGLVRCGRDAALPWLRKVLAGEVVARPDPVASDLPPGGRFRGGAYPPDLDKVPDPVAAAWFLATLEDTESLPAIQRLAEDAEGLDAEVLAAAIGRLSR